MTTHAAPIRLPRLTKQPQTPRDALAAFLERGKREVLIGELTNKWFALGEAEVADAVDHAIATATRAMKATREEAVYDYLRTTAQRALGHLKERAGRISAPIAEDIDFDRLVGDVLSPEEIVLANERRQFVLDLVSALDDRTLAIMRLKHVDGLERRDVARRLGISERTVKKAIERGLRACREQYQTAVEGRLCGERLRAIVAYEAGRATTRQRRQAVQHLAHCAACGSRHRAVAATQRAAAALVPMPLLAVHVGAAGVAGHAWHWAKGQLLGTGSSPLGRVARFGTRGGMVAGGGKAVVAALALALVGGGAHGAPRPVHLHERARAAAAPAAVDTRTSALAGRSRRKTGARRVRSRKPATTRPEASAITTATQAQPPPAAAETETTPATAVPERPATRPKESAPGEFPVL